MSDQGRREKARERYYAAAHRVQTAIAFNPDRPRDQYKDLRVGLDLSKADQAGLVSLLVEKGVFTMEEYLEAVAKSAEDEAERMEHEISVRYGVNVRTV